MSQIDSFPFPLKKAANHNHSLVFLHTERDLAAVESNSSICMNLGSFPGVKIINTCRERVKTSKEIDPICLFGNQGIIVPMYPCSKSLCLQVLEATTSQIRSILMRPDDLETFERFKVCAKKQTWIYTNKHLTTIYIFSMGFF